MYNVQGKCFFYLKTKNNDNKYNMLPNDNNHIELITSGDISAAVGH